MTYYNVSEQLRDNRLTYTEICYLFLSSRFKIQKFKLQNSKFLEFREYFREIKRAAVCFVLNYTSKFWLVSSTPGACNFTEYTVQCWQDFAKFSKQLSSNKMIRQKKAADIISATKNNLLQCQCYSVCLKVWSFQWLSWLFISCCCEIWQLLTLRTLTRSQCLAHVHWISGWCILVMKHLNKFTVEVNCWLKSL